MVETWVKCLFSPHTIQRSNFSTKHKYIRQSYKLDTWTPQTKRMLQLESCVPAGCRQVVDTRLRIKSMIYITLVWFLGLCESDSAERVWDSTGRVLIVIIRVCVNDIYYIGMISWCVLLTLCDCLSPIHRIGERQAQSVNKTHSTDFYGSSPWSRCVMSCFSYATSV